MQQIKLLLKLCKGQSWPDLALIDATCTIVQEEENIRKALITFAVNDKNTIRLIRKSKTGSETIVIDGKIIRDQTVTLEKIWADDILLDLDLILALSVFTNEFSQEYLEYCEKNQIEVADTESHWNTWYLNGTWSWSFEQPFWPWYAQQRQTKEQKYLSEDHIELYAGTGTNQHRSLMQELEDLLENAV